MLWRYLGLFLWLSKFIMRKRNGCIWNFSLSTQFWEKLIGKWLSHLSPLSWQEPSAKLLLGFPYLFFFPFSPVLFHYLCLVFFVLFCFCFSPKPPWSSINWGKFSGTYMFMYKTSNFCLFKKQLYFNHRIVIRSFPQKISSCLILVLWVGDKELGKLGEKS